VVIAQGRGALTYAPHTGYVKKCKAISRKAKAKCRKNKKKLRAQA
jgi:hypothetical protein